MHMNVSDMAKKLQPYIRAVDSKKLGYFGEPELELEKIKLQNSDLLK